MGCRSLCCSNSFQLNSGILTVSIICISITNTNNTFFEWMDNMIITLDFNSDTPIYVQLRNEIVIGIGSGELADGEKLPTVRQMAEDLGINAMTVNKAYAILKNEGFISIDRRHGATVAPIGNGQPEFKEKLENELRLVISEASVKGIGREEFMQMCAGIFSSVSFKSTSITD